jgi:tRNA pseudouridine-54 N-methylase
MPPAFVRAAKGDPPGAGADVFEKFPQSTKREYAKNPPRRVVVLCHGVTSRESAGLFSANNLLQGRVDVWCRCVSSSLYLSDGIRRDTIVSLILRDGDGDDEKNDEKNDESDDEGGGGGRGGGKNGKCRVVSVNGGEVVGLAPDEATIARVLQRALQHASLDALSALGFSDDDDDDDDDGGGGGGAGGETSKSPRNAEKRRVGWLAKQPGSRGPVPGVTVEDHPSLEACLDAVVSGGINKENGKEGTVFVLDLSGTSMIVMLSAADGAGKLAPGCTFVLGDDAGLTAKEMALLEDAHGAVVGRLAFRTLMASHCIVLAHNALDLRLDVPPMPPRRPPKPPIVK